jgi:histidinol dehydrogenase
MKNMKKIILPSIENWQALTSRPAEIKINIDAIVQEIFGAVQNTKDEAVKNYTEKFDGVVMQNIQMSEVEIAIAVQSVSAELKAAINMAKENIESVHQAQVEKLNRIETTKGVVCWRENRGIEKVGIYIPGGTAPLFSTILMLGIPATIAGCKEIILCTPPDKNGNINDVILYTANLIGITKIFKVGGIQAIAAMTFGTETIPCVYKIFGPGNQYVTAAKQMALNYGIAIDMPAGPSEVLVIVDKHANAAFVAADLLSQAEHGADSQVILLSDNENIIDATLVEIRKQIAVLPRQNFAMQAMQNSKAIVLKNIADCIAFSNVYAPEHLILNMQDAEKYIPGIVNAGSVFIGPYTCESLGDYASGTNHTLPTNGYAKSYSGVSVDSFVKKITFQKVSAEGIQNIGPSVELMAEAEGLFAHKNAVSIRLKN